MARPKQAASARQRLRRFYLGLGILAVAGAAALVFAVVRGSGGAAVEPIELADMDDRALYQAARPVVLGDTAAPVKVVVFSDFECPYCGQFAAQVKPQLKQEYVDAGRAQLVYYDFPLGGAHRHSFLAARAARCAGEQGRFWEYHDVLFGRQSRWSRSSGAPVDDFVEYAAELGLDRAAFESCLRSQRYADVVTANRMLGDRLGVSGTPTVIINGRRLSNWSWGELKKAIEEAAGA